VAVVVAVVVVAVAPYATLGSCLLSCTRPRALTAPALPSPP